LPLVGAVVRARARGWTFDGEVKGVGGRLAVKWPW
jgi:hypothetical protein